MHGDRRIGGLGLEVISPKPEMNAGLVSFIYSATFFQEAYTGLSITVLCILTLFAVMQYTARVNWEQAFKGTPPRPEPAY